MNIRQSQWLPDFSSILHVQVWTSFPRALCIWQLIVRCLLCSEIHAVFDFLGDDFVNMSSCSALLARQWIYITRQSPVLNFTHFYAKEFALLALGIISTGSEASGSHLSGAWVACGVRAGFAGRWFQGDPSHSKCCLVPQRIRALH